MLANETTHTYILWYQNYQSPLYFLRLLLRRGVLDTTLCQWFPTGRWFSLGTPGSSTNKTDRRDITDISLSVVLSITSSTLYFLWNDIFIYTVIEKCVSIWTKTSYHYSSQINTGSIIYSNTSVWKYILILNI